MHDVPCGRDAGGAVGLDVDRLDGRLLVERAAGLHEGARQPRRVAQRLEERLVVEADRSRDVEGQRGAVDGPGVQPHARGRLGLLAQLLAIAGALAPAEGRHPREARLGRELAAERLDGVDRLAAGAHDLLRAALAEARDERAEGDIGDRG
jgi:hypothetical protein